MTGVMALTGLSVVAASPAVGADTFQGNVEEIVSPAPGQVRVAGWMFDDDVPTASISYHVYVGGGPGDANAIGFDMGPAGLQRDDVARNYPHAGPFHGFGGTVAVPLRGDQPVYVFAINGGGPNAVNQLMGSRTVFIQNPVPETTITSGPPAQGVDPSVGFAFTADEASTFRCRVDQAAWAVCASPFTTTVAVGAHTFEVYAVDAEGAADATPAAYAFTVVSPPPPPVVVPPPPVVVPPPTPGPQGITLRLRAVERGSRLRIDIGPDLNPSNYRFTVQRLRGTRWRTVERTQTLGARDVSVINLPRGTYRVVVPRQHDMAGAQATARVKR